MKRNVEIVSCDFCGEDIEGMPVTAKCRVYGCEKTDSTPVILYNQIFFNCGGTKYVYDICSKCKDKLDKGEISISTDLSVNRSFSNG